MIKLNVLNMERFLETVNECNGVVNLLNPNGSKKNINKQYGIQSELLEEYRKNKNCLRLSLDVRNSKDYINIVSYYAGDC